MIHKVIIRFEAKQDLREARAWYRNISRELGKTLSAELMTPSLWLKSGR